MRFEIISRDDIERRAFQIYMARGREPGNDLRDWLAAEKELMESKKRVHARTSRNSHSQKAA